jgi:hypothetical protein
MMPKFYFNLTDGKRLVIDEEGDELADTSAARIHALELAELARDLIDTDSSINRDWFEFAFQIVDETGREVALVDFSEVVEATGARPTSNGHSVPWIDDPALS